MSLLLHQRLEWIPGDTNKASLACLFQLHRASQWSVVRRRRMPWLYLKQSREGLLKNDVQARGKLHVVDLTPAHIRAKPTLPCGHKPAQCRHSPDQDSPDWSGICKRHMGKGLLALRGPGSNEKKLTLPAPAWQKSQTSSSQRVRTDPPEQCM